MRQGTPNRQTQCPALGQHQKPRSAYYQHKQTRPIRHDHSACFHYLGPLNPCDSGDPFLAIPEHKGRCHFNPGIAIPVPDRYSPIPIRAWENERNRRVQRAGQNIHPRPRATRFTVSAEINSEPCGNALGIIARDSPRRLAISPLPTGKKTRSPKFASKKGGVLNKAICGRNCSINPASSNTKIVGACALKATE